MHAASAMRGGSRASSSFDGPSIVTFPWGFVRRKKLGPLIRAADAAMSARQWPVAADLYAQVLEAQPALWHLRVQRGHALKELGQINAAIDEYLVSAQGNPDAADPRMHLGHLYRLQGDAVASEENYRLALLADPNCDASRHLQTATTTSSPQATQQFIDPGHRPTVFWEVGRNDVGSVATTQFDEESCWFEELGRQAQFVAVRFDPARGCFVHAKDGSDLIDGKQAGGSHASSIYVTSMLGESDPMDTARALSAAQLSLRASVVGVQRTFSSAASRRAHLIRSNSSLLLVSQDVAAQLRADAWRHRRSGVATVVIRAVDRPVRRFQPERTFGPVDPADNTPGILLFGWPADATDHEAWRDQLARLSTHFGHCIAFAAEAASEADLASRCDPPPPARAVIGRREAWLALEAPGTAGLLLPPGIGSNDLWAIRATDAGVRVFADGGDERTPHSIGGSAIFNGRSDECDVSRRWFAASAQPMFPEVTFAAWLPSLMDIVDHAELRLQPALVLASVRFGVLYRFASGPDCEATLDASFLLAGSGWHRLDGAYPAGGTDARIRIVVAAHQQIACRLLVGVSHPISGAEQPPHWQQAMGRSQSPRADGFAIVDIDLPANQLDARFGTNGWNIRGMVFHPIEQDHFWFEFLDRASRGVESL